MTDSEATALSPVERTEDYGPVLRELAIAAAAEDDRVAIAWYDRRPGAGGHLRQAPPDREREILVTGSPRRRALVAAGRRRETARVSPGARGSWTLVAATAALALAACEPVAIYGRIVPEGEPVRVVPGEGELGGIAVGLLDEHTLVEWTRPGEEHLVVPTIQWLDSDLRPAGTPVELGLRISHPEPMGATRGCARGAGVGYADLRHRGAR
ncbi:MAG: hypothetical protein M5U28_25835 [Sandaracinaceae bacterium]|nr:hypothetical protein [Sandaracinaceae bacterium]